MQSQFRKIVLTSMLFGLFLSFPATAKEKADWRSWPMGDRFILAVGAFFPNLDTKVSARSASEPVGAEISFERDLGLDSTATRPIAGFGWRFAKKHRLGINYFNLDRSGDTISKVNIKIGDIDIPIGVPVQSFFDVAVLEVGYSYSLVFTEKTEWSVGLGLSLQDVDIGILADDGQILESQDASVALPLPTLNTTLGYAFTDKWIGRVNLGWLAVEADLSESTDFEGSIWNGSIGMRYKAFEHFGFDFAMTYFDVDVDYYKRDLIGTLDYRYLGPVISLEWRW